MWNRVEISNTNHSIQMLLLLMHMGEAQVPFTLLNLTALEMNCILSTAPLNTLDTHLVLNTLRLVLVQNIQVLVQNTLVQKMCNVATVKMLE